MKTLKVWIFPVLLSLAILGLVARVVAGITGAEGRAEGDALSPAEWILLFFGPGISAVLLILWLIRERARARGRRLRQMFPEAVVVAISTRPEDTAALNALTGSSLAPKALFMSVILGEKEITWWTGRTPSQVARVSSEQPIQYRQGVTNHLGVPAPVLAADLLVDGVPTSCSFIVTDEVFFPFGTSNLERGIAKALAQVSKDAKRM